jgi:hypothetical protein
MFDSYECDAADASSLKQDQRDHPRTSRLSLRQLARSTYATPTCKRTRKEVQAWLRDPYRRAPNKAQYWPTSSTSETKELEAAMDWLSIYGCELEREIENEEGQLSHGRSYYETTGGYDVALETYSCEANGASTYERHGIYHTERLGENEPLLSIAMGGDEHARANPTSHSVRLTALAIRGARFAANHAQRKARLKWRGMEEWDAVAKADDHTRKGLSRTKAKANALPLDVDALRERFEVVDGELVNRRLGRAVKHTQVRVAGVLHSTGRVIYAVEHGSDPSDKVISNGEASDYRAASGSATERGDGKWDAFVAFGKHTVTVGEYKSEAQAIEAASIFLKSLARGL